jgi:hypothetical protein
LAACLSSTDVGATAASHPPAEPLLPLVALYFIMADCYVVALAPAPSSHCCSRRHCCHRFVIVTARPHLRRNPIRRRKRQKKSIFIYGTTFKKNKSGSDFQRIQIWNDRSQKQKKNYGRHPIKADSYGSLFLFFVWLANPSYVHFVPTGDLLGICDFIPRLKKMSRKKC